MDNNKNSTLIFLIMPEIIENISRQFRRGNKVLENANAIRMDCVILDLTGPEMDGLEVFDNLRSNPETSNIPILMLTNTLEPQARYEVITTSMDAFLTNPVETIELETSVGPLNVQIDNSNHILVSN